MATKKQVIQKIEEAMEKGFGWACDQCYSYKNKECPILWVAKFFNVPADQFSGVDSKKLAKKIVQFLLNQGKNNSKEV